MSNKIKIALFLSLLTITGCLPVLANNHKDSNWHVTLPRLQGNAYTPARQKQDKSSGYIKLNEIGKGGIRAWMILSDGTQVDSPKTTLHRGQDKKISNYAYEYYGKVDVKMAIESDYWNVVTINAEGVWSPDSI